MAYNPSTVTTKLVLKDNKDASCSAITPEKAAEVCFRDLGNTPQTHGAFMHEVSAKTLHLIPRFAFKFMFKGVRDYFRDPSIKEKKE